MPRAFSSGALSIWSIRRERRAARLGQDLGDRRRQRRLAMVDVTDRADVAVRLVALELFLGHVSVLRSRLLEVVQPGSVSISADSGVLRPGPRADDVADGTCS